MFLQVVFHYSNRKAAQTKELELQHPLQGYTPNDLTSSDQASTLKSPTTSPKHHDFVTKMPLHEPLGEHLRAKLQQELLPPKSKICWL